MTGSRRVLGLGFGLGVGLQFALWALDTGHPPWVTGTQLTLWVQVDDNVADVEPGKGPVLYLIS